MPTLPDSITTPQWNLLNFSAGNLGEFMAKCNAQLEAIVTLVRNGLSPRARWLSFNSRSFIYWGSTMFAGRLCGLCWQWTCILGTFCRNWSRTGWPVWPSSPGPVRWGNTGSWLVTSLEYWPLIGQLGSGQGRLSHVLLCIFQILLDGEDGEAEDDPHESELRVRVPGQHQPAGHHPAHGQVGAMLGGRSVVRYKIFPEQCCVVLMNCEYPASASLHRTRLAVK